MAQLLLINPKKRGKRKMARKRRTAAQKAATRKMIAANRSRRRRNPGPRAVAKRTRPGKRPTMRTAMTANPRRRRVVRRRRNPNGGRLTMRNVMNNNVMPAFQGAMGGLSLDILWGYLPIPVEFKTGMMRHIIKGGGALAMGMVAQNFVRPATARSLTTGALTTVMHSALRETVAQFAPNIPLGEYIEGMGYYSAGQITSPQYGNGNNNNNNNNAGMGQVPYGSPMTPMGEYMGPDDSNMSAYESGIEGDLMGMGVGVYE